MLHDIFNEYQPYIFLLIGIALIVYSCFHKSTTGKLKETGIPVEGIIYEQSSGNDSSGMFGNSSNLKNKITVRFVTQDQDQLWITGVMNQDFAGFYTGQYKEGETVKVYYDKDNPTNFYVDTKQSETLGRIVFGLSGLAFIILGLYKLFM